MRTSYDRGNPQKPRNEEVQAPERVDIKSSFDSPVQPEEDNAVYNMIVSGFTQLKDSMDEASIVNDSKTPAVEPTKPTTKPKKKFKVWVLILIIAGVLTLAGIAAGVIGVLWLRNNAMNIIQPTTESPDVYIEQYDSIKASIDNLYANGEKSEIAIGYTVEDLDAIYNDLDFAEEHGENVSDLFDELDTIARYITDNESLIMLESEDYDLAQDVVAEGLLKVKSSADRYHVLGLKGSIYERADALLSMRETYLKVKSELLGVSDLLSFEASEYEGDIASITHTHNREELNLLLSKVSADSLVAVAEANLSKAVGTENEASATKSLEDAKVVQKAAIDAWNAFNGVGSNVGGENEPIEDSM